jgi:hypothetical protein
LCRGLRVHAGGCRRDEKEGRRSRSGRGMEKENSSRYVKERGKTQRREDNKEGR